MFKVARDLSMTAGELQQRMTSTELGLWAAFYNVEAAEQAEAHRKAVRDAKAGRR